MTVEIFTLCEKATSRKGAMWIQRTFDTIESEYFPNHLPPCQMAVRLRLQPNQNNVPIKMSFALTDPEGVDVMAPVDLSLHRNRSESGGDTVAFLVDLSGSALPSQGKYTAELIKENGDRLISMPITVKARGADLVPKQNSLN